MTNNIKDDLEQYSRRIYEIAYILRTHKREPGEITIDNLINALPKGSSNMNRDLKGYYAELLKIENIFKTNGYNTKAITIEAIIREHLN